MTNQRFRSSHPEVILKRRCSENMQQIYRRTLMPKCGFNKVAMQLYWNRNSAWVFSVNLLHIFRTPFPRNTSGWLLLKIISSGNRKICCKIFSASKLLFMLENCAYLATIFSLFASSYPSSTCGKICSLYQSLQAAIFRLTHLFGFHNVFLQLDPITLHSFKKFDVFGPSIRRYVFLHIYDIF